MAFSEQTVSQFGIPHVQTSPDERARLTVTSYNDDAPQVVSQLEVETAEVDHRGNRLWRCIGTAVLHRDVRTDALVSEINLHSYGGMDTETAMIVANALVWAAATLEIERDWITIFSMGERYGP